MARTRRTATRLSPPAVCAACAVLCFAGPRPLGGAAERLQGDEGHVPHVPGRGGRRGHRQHGPWIHVGSSGAHGVNHPGITAWVSGRGDAACAGAGPPSGRAGVGWGSGGSRGRKGSGVRASPSARACGWLWGMIRAGCRRPWGRHLHGDDNHLYDLQQPLPTAAECMY